MKSTWYKVYNYGKAKEFKKKLWRSDENDRGEFQQHSPQRLFHKYKHKSSRNDRWRMRLKLIQEEYYFIGHQKS